MPTSYLLPFVQTSAMIGYVLYHTDRSPDWPWLRRNVMSYIDPSCRHIARPPSLPFFFIFCAHHTIIAFPTDNHKPKIHYRLLFVLDRRWCRTLHLRAPYWRLLRDQISALHLWWFEPDLKKKDGESVNIMRAASSEINSDIIVIRRISLCLHANWLMEWHMLYVEIARLLFRLRRWWPNELHSTTTYSGSQNHWWSIAENSLLLRLWFYIVFSTKFQDEKTGCASCSGIQVQPAMLSWIDTDFWQRCLPSSLQPVLFHLYFLVDAFSLVAFLAAILVRELISIFHLSEPLSVVRFERHSRP